ASRARQLFNVDQESSQRRRWAFDELRGGLRAIDGEALLQKLSDYSCGAPNLTSPSGIERTCRWPTRGGTAAARMDYSRGGHPGGYEACINYRVVPTHISGGRDEGVFR